MLAFLDVLLVNRFGTIDTAVYRKETNTDLYINWNSYAPEKWKKGTLKNLIKWAFTICNQPYFLNAELEHLQFVFVNINGYPVNLIKRTIEQVRKDIDKERQPKQPSDDLITNEETQTTNVVKIYLPYANKQGEKITKDINKTVSKIFNKKVTAKVSFKSKKLSSFFSVKDKTEIKHKHNLVYKVTCADCPATYIGEAGRRLQERVDDHGGRDKNSHVLKHSLERGHSTVKFREF